MRAEGSSWGRRGETLPHRGSPCRESEGRGQGAPDTHLLAVLPEEQGSGKNSVPSGGNSSICHQLCVCRQATCPSGPLFPRLQNGCWTVKGADGCKTLRRATGAAFHFDACRCAPSAILPQGRHRGCSLSANHRALQSTRGHRVGGVPEPLASKVLQMVQTSGDQPFSKMLNTGKAQLIFIEQTDDIMITESSPEQLIQPSVSKLGY